MEVWNESGSTVWRIWLHEQAIRDIAWLYKRWNNFRCRLVFEFDFHGNVLALAIFEVNLDFLSRS